jgi:hypothetical protein
MTKKPVKRYTVDGKRMTTDDRRRLHDYLAASRSFGRNGRRHRGQWQSLSTSCRRNDDPSRHRFDLGPAGSPETSI